MVGIKPVRRGLFAAVLTVAATLCVGVPAALASSTVSMSYPASVATGKQFTVSVSGVHDPTDCGSGCSVNVFILPPPEQCGDSSADTEGLQGAERLINTYQPPDGDYTYSVTSSGLKKPGVYAICGFIDTQWHNPEPIENPTGTLTVGATSGTSPTDTSTTSTTPVKTSLALSFPTTVYVKQSSAMTITGYDDNSRSSCGKACSVNVFILPADEKCGAKAASDVDIEGSDRIVETYEPHPGSFTRIVQVPKFKRAGTYNVCGYIDDQHDDPPALATTVGTIHVLTPAPPACIVPQSDGLTATAVIAAIQADGCTVGSLTLVTSTTVPLGDVVALSAVAGTEEANGTAVDLTVSTGPGDTTPPS